MTTPEGWLNQAAAALAQAQVGIGRARKGFHEEDYPTAMLDVLVAAKQLAEAGMGLLRLIEGQQEEREP